MERYLFQLLDKYGNNIEFEDSCKNKYTRLKAPPVSENIYSSFLSSSTNKNLDRYIHSRLYVKLEYSKNGIKPEKCASFYVKIEDKYLYTFITTDLIIQDNKTYIMGDDILIYNYFVHGLFIFQNTAIYKPSTLRAKEHIINIPGEYPSEGLKNEYFSQPYDRGDLIEFRPPHGNYRNLNKYIYTGEKFIEPDTEAHYDGILPKEFTSYEYPIDYFIKAFFPQYIHIDIERQRETILKSYSKYAPFAIINKYGDRIFISEKVLSELKNTKEKIITLNIDLHYIPSLLEKY